MKKKSKITLTAALVVAMAFTFSCGIVFHSGGSTYSPSGKDSEHSGGSCNASDYAPVTIGEQVWMSKNLNCNVAGSKCYNNDPANCQKYGRLYDWETAMKACPSGWHLPSNEEWQVLVDFAGGDKAAKKNLKASSGWNSGGNGQDTYDFSALPGGVGSAGNFVNVGDGGYWWSSSGGNYADDWYMYYSYEYVDHSVSDKYNLFSVRCLQD